MLKYITTPVPHAARLRREHPNLERRAGAWLRDIHHAASKPGFSISRHLAELAVPSSATPHHRGRTAPVTVW
jgi:hypothetical protein